MEMNRRQFAERLARATGAIMLIPSVAACGADGYIAFMWRDPAKGYAKHLNAGGSEENT